jgi:hypothetical protein
MIDNDSVRDKHHIAVEPLLFQVHCPRQVAFRAEQEATRLLQASLGNQGSKSCFRVSASCAKLLQCFSLKVSQGVKGLNGSHSLVFFLLKINTQLDQII